MWSCPKCGREFKRQNQSHYCGEAPQSVEEYISLQDEKCQDCLTDLVRLIREVAPDSAGSIKWSMPSFKGKAGSLQFSACKKWVSLYVGADVIELFREELEQYDHKKDALYLPYHKELERGLIGKVISWCLNGRPF